MRSFQYANPGVALAHHLHCSGHMRGCLDVEVPVVALIREPLATLSSAMVFMNHDDPDEAPFRYLRLYRWMQNHAGRLLISDFRVTTTDFSRLVACINERFGTSYATLEAPETAREAVFETIDTHFGGGAAGRVSKLPLPVAERDVLKRALQPRIEAHARFGEVKHLYRELLSLSVH